jgi:tetratricopeptide (TPR) repeat protein
VTVPSGQGGGGRFSALLLEGLDHYRKGKMMEAVRAWEEAYLLEPSNLRAREFLKSALERIHSHMGTGEAAEPLPAGAHPWLGDVPTTPKTPTRPPPPPPASYPPSPTPWDEGPSMALPQSEPDGGDEQGAVWGIHDEVLPVASVENEEMSAWSQGARELVALNDFSGALELLSKILARKPNDPEALRLSEICEENLTQMYESKLGSMDRVPRVALPPDEIIWLNLDPRAGFVLAQIDGMVSFDDLYAVCGLRRLDTARILSQLVEEGVVVVEGEAMVAKRAMTRQR